VINSAFSLVLFHVTPAENVQSILECGIDPKYATGKMKAAWFVSKQRIEWALIHTSAHHHVQIDELAVCAVMVYGRDMYKFNRPGFYYTYITHKIETATPAMFFLHSIGMGEIEND